jgi:hypothetical protein
MNRVARQLVLALGLAAGAAIVAPSAAWAQPAEDKAPGKGKAPGKDKAPARGKARGKGKAPAKAPAEAPAPIPGPSLGGDPAPVRCNPEGDTESGQFHVEEQDGQKVYVIDKAITVCGKVPRPLVAYVLQPRSINWEFEGMKQEFLPKIRESVKKAPF